MAKTGDDTKLGTAEGAVTSRAAHSIHAKDPVLDDFWAVELLLPPAQAEVRDPEVYRTNHVPMGWIAAVGIGCLRLAEDEVARQVDAGVRQYVLLGAGFDTFALRRDDLVDRVQVFEVDHPDVQKLKRERIEAAERSPASMPEFVPVDFEVMSIEQGLQASSFDPTQPAIFTWMNTVPYLSAEAVTATVDGLSRLAAPGSRLVVNYGSTAAMTPVQLGRLKELMASVASAGEPFRKRWEPEEFVALLSARGFDIVEHADEHVLAQRYFAGRGDGFEPGLPLRVITAERRR